jgi:hypothetical protein
MLNPQEPPGSCRWFQGLGLGGINGGLGGHRGLGRLSSSRLGGLLGAGQSHQLAAVPVAIVVAPTCGHANTAQHSTDTREQGVMDRTDQDQPEDNSYQMTEHIQGQGQLMGTALAQHLQQGQSLLGSNRLCLRAALDSSQ